MSAYGYADGQSITGWLGVPLATATGLALGAGTYVDGPFALTNFASIIVAIKPTGGPVTLRVKQAISSGPAALVLEEDLVVTAGEIVFQAFVLYGDSVTVELDGSVGGTTVDYAVYPSNTTTNAQVIQSATINVQHDGALVGTEPSIDFEDAAGFAWTVTDDGPNQRIKIAAPAMPRQLGYQTFTVPVTLANVAEAAATQIVTAPAIAFNGLTTIVCRLQFPELLSTPGSTIASIWLFMDGASIGLVGRMHNVNDPNSVPVTITTDEITPAAGNHTFSFRGTSNLGDAVANVGPGGLGQYRPGSIAVIAV